MSHVVCVNVTSCIVLEFPTQAEINRMLESRKHVFLIGFENNRKDGTGMFFNFVLSNGSRSTQKDEGMTYYD